jgi:TetR/AcrR family transcriptional regulator, transcriptional repressor for nem operon
MEFNRQAVRDIRSEQVLWLTGVLGALLPAANSASVLASLVYACCQGALTTARISGRVEDFDEVISQVKRML